MQAMFFLVILLALLFFIATCSTDSNEDLLGVKDYLLLEKAKEIQEKSYYPCTYFLEETAQYNFGRNGYYTVIVDGQLHEKGNYNGKIAEGSSIEFFNAMQYKVSYDNVEEYFTALCKELLENGIDPYNYEGLNDADKKMYDSIKQKLQHDYLLKEWLLIDNYNATLQSGYVVTDDSTIEAADSGYDKTSFPLADFVKYTFFYDKTYVKITNGIVTEKGNYKGTPSSNCNISLCNVREYCDTQDSYKLYEMALERALNESGLDTQYMWTWDENTWEKYNLLDEACKAQYLKKDFVKKADYNIVIQNSYITTGYTYY